MNILLWFLWLLFDVASTECLGWWVFLKGVTFLYSCNLQDCLERRRLRTKVCNHHFSVRIPQWIIRSTSRGCLWDVMWDRIPIDSDQYWKPLKLRVMCWYAIEGLRRFLCFCLEHFFIVLAFASVCHVILKISDRIFGKQRYNYLFCTASWRASLLILLRADLGTQYVSNCVLVAFKVVSKPKASKRASSTQT